VSPLTRNVPRLKSAVVLAYKISTKRCKNALREITVPTPNRIIELEKSSGFHIPSIQDTEYTTITSLRAYTMDEGISINITSYTSVMTINFSLQLVEQTI